MNSPRASNLEICLDDVFLLQGSLEHDERGALGNLHIKENLETLNIPTLELKHFAYSVSNNNVIRGMHYQPFPHGTAKLVSVVKGKIMYVVVGIGGKFNTRNYGKTFSAVLSQNNSKSLYIPDGYAHGFKCLEDDSIVACLQSNAHRPELGSGIHWQSFGFDWDIADPILSLKDKSLPPLCLQLGK